MKIRNYKFQYNDGYIVGFYPPDEGETPDFVGQMALFPDVNDSFIYGGYYKFINGEFVLDEERKEEMLKKWEEEHNVSQ